jgi:hypothetical protein
MIIHKIWLIVRDWTDRMVGKPGTAAEAALFPALLPMVLVILADQFINSGYRTWVLVACVGWFVGWNMFAGWRYWRHLKEISLKGDRHFDRVGKYDLPPEYADSESATKAKQRRER